MSILIDMVVDRHGRVHYPAGTPGSKGGEYAPKWVRAVSARMQRGRTRIVRYSHPERPRNPDAQWRMDHLDEWVALPDLEGNAMDRPSLPRRFRDIPPDRMVTLYRSNTPGEGGIAPGDWVTMDRRYAEQHNAGGTIAEMRVPARDVSWAGTDIGPDALRPGEVDYAEWFYMPRPGRKTMSDLARELRGQHYGLELEFVERDGYTVLEKIALPKSDRGKGTGTAVMRAIVEHADREGITLALSPSNMYGGTFRRLKEFYPRFGFESNERGRGRLVDPTILAAMFRRPRQP